LLDPDKALLALVTLAVIGFTVASLVLVVRCRTLLAYGCVLAQVPLFFAWSAVDGGAASCLIG
jgi:predicted aconitase with swiveling domain